MLYDGHKVYMNGSYPAIFLNGKNQHIHRLEWEKYYGAIPENCIVHHIDEDKLNWSITNLELLNRADHMNKHRNIIHRKGVNVIATKKGVTLKFNSIKEAAIFCETYPCSIRRCLNNKQKAANGWTFNGE